MAHVVWCLPGHASAAQKTWRRLRPSSLGVCFLAMLLATAPLFRLRAVLSKTSSAGLDRSFAVRAPSGRKLPKRPTKLDKKEEYDVPGTRYQGGRRGVQFFLGDLVECQRDGEWQPARVSKAPTDERPGDGAFRVMWNSDAYEMKAWYKDLRKPKYPEKIPMPDWVEDWWPEEPPPEPDYCGNETDPTLNFVIKGPFPKEFTPEEMFWRNDPPADAYEILESEHFSDAERRAEGKIKNSAEKRRRARLRAERDKANKEWEDQCAVEAEEKRQKRIAAGLPPEEPKEYKGSKLFKGEDFNLLTVDELQRQLKELGQSTLGSKQDLIGRLKSNL